MDASAIVSSRTGQKVNYQGGAVPLRSEFGVLLFLAIIWIVICALLEPIGEFPLNDDWVYALAVRAILATGRFALTSPASANVIAQAYWGALFCLPVGFSFTALRLSTLVLGGLGILALYLLLRELGGRRETAVVGALTMAVNPFYLSLAASFMTDVPFTSLFTISLWLYVRGVRRGDLVSLGAAFVLAFTAIFIRQFGLVLLLAFGAAHITRKGTQVRVVAAAILPFVLAIALQIGYDHWLIASGRTPQIPVPLDHLLPNTGLAFALRIEHTALSFLPYLGLCVAPFLAYLILVYQSCTQTNVWRPFASWSLSTLFSLFLLEIVVRSDAILPCLGDILTTTGLGPLTLRDTWLLHRNLPQISHVVMALWIIMTALSVWMAVLMVPFIKDMIVDMIQSIRCPKGRTAVWSKVLLLTLAVSYAGGVLLISNTAPVFDRYVLPLIPVCLAILVAVSEQSRSIRKQPWRLVPSMLLLVLYAAFSMAATHDYLAWNRARWQASNFLLQAGITPHDIDGGYEFNGWYLYNPNYKITPGKSYWWVDDDEYVIVSGLLSGYSETRQFRFDRWLGLTESSVLILHRVAKRHP